MSTAAPITVLLMVDEAEVAERQARLFLEHTPAGLCSIWLLHTAKSPALAPGVLTAWDPGAQLYLPGLEPAAAWNQALALGSSPYVLFLRTDQIWRPQVLAAVFDRITEAEADLAYVGWTTSGAISMPPDLRHENPERYWLQQAPWPLAACVFSRTALARVGGLDPECGEVAGYDLLLRLGANVQCVRHAEIGLDLATPILGNDSPAERVNRALRLAQIRSRCLTRPGNTAGDTAGPALRRELIVRPLQSLAQELQAQNADGEALQIYRYLAASGDCSMRTFWGGLQAGWSLLTRR